ncbi:cytochrome c-type biogenesis protein CcsB [Anaeromyxobacter sp. K]|uniref:Cytochrome c-type biogenesis protein CcsB n=1 Tax=Anaeromyxobacter dehalogenans (strain ATCC BAA-258 / DSM 21875 / 2CP-1) TaxID=455488 RepID=B8JDX2_ANAD2|nr:MULTISPECIES: c-type cytochrome biogenesis protein CcsB [Anaeromyxobacter]ACG72097.1 cytochrome c-type biogenesis protein CcsB [Anaeromyxobacter sp. K]ACL64217.1 cytochrome c-type biogenesis protein CcsB [Anaeromyxobacter dehalogenans 2CP-1]
MLQYILAEHPFFVATGALYAAAAGFYAAAWRSTRALVGRAATALLCAALAFNAGLIVERWIEAGRAPFKSLFESLVFFAFTTGVVYLAFERLYRTRVFGALAALLTLALLGYALGKWDAEIVKLPPALQSAWFVPHVVVYFVGYAAVALAALLAAVQLLAPRVPLLQRLTTLRAGTILTGKALDLEQMTYELIRFGFVLLTVGLLVGSVWAKSAWGDFWVWDPKENWSLVTWLVYGAYLHLRKVRGWRGDRAAWLVLLGFAVVMFTYLGMSMLPTAEESAHVYTG